jgi:predicted HTH domain antitoxin
VPVTIPDSVLAAAHLTEPELRRELAVALFREERLTLGLVRRQRSARGMEWRGLPQP